MRIPSRLARSTPSILLALLVGLAFPFAGARASTDGTSIVRLTSQPTGRLRKAHFHHTATRLDDGRVLVVGGNNTAGKTLKTTEIYDPTSGTWTVAASTRAGRSYHTATLLADGRVLIVGGQPKGGATNVAEVFDPASGTWSDAGDLGRVVNGHTATLLADGRVLVVGGQMSQLFDPQTSTFSAPAPIVDGYEPGFLQTATLLADGRVLVTGGSNGLFDFNSPHADAVIFDPASETWSRTADLQTPRLNHAATLLPTGEVLVTDGVADGQAELYDPTAGTWRYTGRVLTGHFLFAMVGLADGSVLIMGDRRGNTTIERYSPDTGLWTDVGALAGARGVESATLLANGTVLVAGGFSLTTGKVLKTCELITP